MGSLSFLHGIGRDLVASHDAFYNFKIRNYLKDLTRVLNKKLTDS